MKKLLLSIVLLLSGINLLNAFNPPQWPSADGLGPLGSLDAMRLSPSDPSSVSISRSVLDAATEKDYGPITKKNCAQRITLKSRGESKSAENFRSKCKAAGYQIGMLTPGYYDAQSIQNNQSNMTPSRYGPEGTGG